MPSDGPEMRQVVPELDEEVHKALSGGVQCLPCDPEAHLAVRMAIIS
jgi:hypothetical protein